MSGVITTAEEGKELPISLPFGVVAPAIEVAGFVTTVVVVTTSSPASFSVVVVTSSVTAALVSTVSIIVIGPPLDVLPKIVPVQVTIGSTPMIFQAEPYIPFRH